MGKNLVILCSVVIITHTEATCLRPEVLESKETYCYRSHVDFIDRVYETSQTLLNLAKKKFGREVVEDEKVPEKCEYYQCILQELHLLNSEKYPTYAVIKSWIEENVIFLHGIELLKRLSLCNETLSNSTVSNLRFRGDLTVEAYQNEGETDFSRKCDLDAEFLRCLSLQQGCSIFKYP